MNTGFQVINTHTLCLCVSTQTVIRASLTKVLWEKIRVGGESWWVMHIRAKTDKILDIEPKHSR